MVRFKGKAIVSIYKVRTALAVQCTYPANTILSQEENIRYPLYR